MDASKTSSYLLDPRYTGLLKGDEAVMGAAREVAGKVPAGDRSYDRWKALCDSLTSLRHEKETQK